MWTIINNIKKMPRISILKCLLSQLNCLLQRKHQKLSKLYSRFLETIHLHLFDIRVSIFQTKLVSGVLSSLRYGTFFELTTYRCRTGYLLFLFSCTQNIFRHLDIICQTFAKLISTLDRDVFILYLYSWLVVFLFIRKTTFSQI